MAQKVKQFLLLINQRVTQTKNGSHRPALGRGLIFGLALLALEAYGFFWLMSVGFIILAIILYFNPLFNTRRLFFTFVILTIFSFLITTKFAIHLPQESSLAPQVAFAAFFGFLFYLLIGVKQLIFIRRVQAYFFLFLSTIYLGLLLYFAAEKISPLSGLVKFIALALFVLIIIREFLRNHRYPKTRLLTATTFTLALINLEAIWAISLLPIEFTGAASLATLFMFLTTEGTRRYLQEELNAKFIRYSLLSFVFLCAIILSFSHWRP